VEIDMSVKKILLSTFLIPTVISCSEMTENTFSLNCPGTETIDSSIFGKSSKNKNKILHFKNKLLENYDCNTWNNEKIVCVFRNNGEGISNIKNDTTIEIDRISGNISIDSTGSIHDEKKELISSTRTMFQGKCEKLVGQKF